MATAAQLHPLRAHGLLLFAAVAWAGSYVVGRYGVSDASPLSLTVWRWAPAAVLLILCTFRSLVAFRASLRRSAGRLLLLSLLGVVLYPMTLYLAVAHTTALNASLYLAAAPVIIILLARLFYGDPIGWTGTASAVLGLAGALAILLRGDPGASAALRLAWGDTWAVASTLAWAGYCVALPLKPKELPELPFLAAIVGLGVLVLAPLHAAELLHGARWPSQAAALWSMAYFAVFPSLLAYLAWNSGVALIGPSSSAAYNNLIPLLGGVMGILFLVERVETYHGVGATLVVASLGLNAMRSSASGVRDKALASASSSSSRSAGRSCRAGVEAKDNRPAHNSAQKR